MKIKKLKIKLNKDNEYSDYRYFIPKSNNIKMTDGRDVDEAVQSLKDKIANLKEQANYLINKAPLVKYAEGSSITATECADAPLKKFTIEGDSYQEGRSGKNLLRVTALTTEVDGVVFTVNPDGTVLINGTNTGNTNIAFNLCAPGELLLNANTNYKILGKPIINLENPGVYLQVAYYKEGEKAYATADKEFSTIEENINNEQGAYVYIRFDKGVTVENLIIYPMITLATENNYQYEQYGVSPSLDYPSKIQSIDTPIEINNYNANLFIKENAGKPIGNVSNYISTEYLAVKKGDIITKNNNTTLFFYNKDKQQITSIATWTTGTINIDNVAYIRCNLLEKDKDNFMIVKNQELPKDYVEGEGQKLILEIQQPFRAIGNVKDRFVKKDGVWYEEHNINRKIFDGIINKFNSKHTSIQTETNGFYHLILDNKMLGKPSGSTEYGICNYLKFVSGGASTAVKKDGLWWEGHTNVNYASIPFLKTVEANQWLVGLNDNGTPFYIDYVLAEPLLIPCTSEQVETLESLKTYNNITYLDLIINNELYPNIKVAYKQDLNLLIEEGI